MCTWGRRLTTPTTEGNNTQMPSLRNHVPGSALYKHVRNTHPDGPSPAFKMKVTGVYGKDALLRQVAEGVQINAASEEKKCMNSRAEWNHQAIPRITLRDD